MSNEVGEPNVLEDYQPANIVFTTPTTPAAPTRRASRRRTASNAKEIEEKRDKLWELADKGLLRPYSGREISPGDVLSLPSEDVRKIHDRFEVSSTNMVTNGIVNSALGLFVNVLSSVIPIVDGDGLRNEIQRDELIKQQLNVVANKFFSGAGEGTLAMAALGSLGFLIANHVDYGSLFAGSPPPVRGAGEAGELTPASPVRSTPRLQPPNLDEEAMLEQCLSNAACVAEP
jgi:hypothetical protein